MPTWFWLLVSIAVLIVVVLLVASLVLRREAGRSRLLPLLRPFYKHLANPSALRAAARGNRRWGVLHHVGRRSGATYDTPIDAQRTPDGVVISLVYGSSVDWCRNVLAAGHCTLTLDGKELELTAPQVIDLRDAAPWLSPERARFWRSMGIEHCLSLQAASG